MARRVRLVRRIKRKPVSEKDTVKGREDSKVSKGQLSQGLVGHTNNFVFNAKSHKNH